MTSNDPVYLYLFDDPQDSTKDYVITGWGRTLNENKRVCVNIHGYMPYFSIIGRITSTQEPANENQLYTLISDMESPMRANYNKPVHRSIVKRRTIYFYEEVYQCVVYFRNMMSYYAYRKKVKEYKGQHGTLEVADDVATPLIKFFGERDVAPCCWLQIDSQPLPSNHFSRTSTDDVEYSIVYTAISKVDPQPAKLPNFIRMIYDIECYGSNEFGLPKAWKVTDEIIDISVDVTDLDETFVENHQFCQANVDSVEGSVLHRFDNERDLLIAFLRFIYEKNPDILETYNGFGFDNPYIHGRFSRYFSHYGKLGRSAVVDSTWKERASGGYSSKTSFLYHNDQRIRMPGRFDLDLYNIVKKEEGRRLKRNTLGAVAKHVLGEGKMEMDFREGFEAFRNHKLYPEDEHWKEKMKYFLTYAKKDSELTRRLVTKKRTIQNLFMSSSNFGIPPFQLYIGGQQQKLVAMIHREAYKLGITLNRRNADRVEYKGGIVEHPVPGYYTRVFVVDFAGMYPSIMLDKNICLSTFIPPHRRHMYKEEDVWMIQTRRGPIHWFVRQPDVDADGKDIPHPVRRRGLIPMIVLKIINGRADVKRKLREVTDSMARAILVILELFLKESANSMYGVLGLQGEQGKFSCIEAAEAVTDTGADYITQVGHEIMTTHNCVIPYGDTDSKFGKSRDPNRDPHECMNTVATEVTRKLFHGTPVRVEGEKVIDMILLMPKKYIFFLLDKKCQRMIDDKSTLESKFGDKLHTKEGVLELLRNKDTREILQKALKTKGDVLVRKDTCDWQREVYFDIAFCCFYNFTFEDIVEVLYDHVQKLFRGQVSVADLTYVARYNASAGSSHHVVRFVESLRAYGYDIEDGAGLDYVMCDTGEKEASKRMRMPEMIGQTPIDYSAYLEKLIAHVDAVIWARYGCEYYFRQVFYDNIPVLNPCKMLHKIIHDKLYPPEYLLYLSRCTIQLRPVEVSWEQYMHSRWMELSDSQRKKYLQECGMQMYPVQNSTTQTPRMVM